MLLALTRAAGSLAPIRYSVRVAKEGSLRDLLAALALLAAAPAEDPELRSSIATGPSSHEP